MNLGHQKQRHDSPPVLLKLEVRRTKKELITRTSEEEKKIEISAHEEFVFQSGNGGREVCLKKELPETYLEWKC